MCSDWSVLLGLADYSRGKRDRSGREGKKRERGAKRKRGSERYSSESSEARQIQWRNPPSSQMNIAASFPPPPSPPPPVSIAVFFPPPFLAPSPLFISALLRVSSSRLQPIHRACRISSPPRLATFPHIRPSIYPSIPEHGDPELALFCC